MSKIKQILAGFLVAVMVVTGLAVTPMDAKATETTETVEAQVDENGEATEAIYVLDDVNYRFTKYWTTDSKIAPIREGYVFSGWYNKTDDGFEAILQSEGSNYTSAYAKFVPAEVLSVRAQLETETETYNGKDADGNDKAATYLRLLSGVNGLDYQKVGFDIYYGKTIHETNEKATNITNVYQNITKSDTDESTQISAESLFGSAATHISVLRLKGILHVNFEKVIYVTPQWTTLDGTFVEGQAKYVRVIDGYTSNQYISVPVNFLTGSEVAAGQLDIEYDSTKLQVVGFDAGTLMPEMSYTDDEAGTIKIVGNVDADTLEKLTNVEPESKIYANVWFQVKTDSETGTKVDTSDIAEWTFTMKNLSFCNLDETMVTDLSAWTVKHLK